MACLYHYLIYMYTLCAGAVGLNLARENLLPGNNKQFKNSFMAFNISINYEGKDITYEVESTQEEVYILRMTNDSEKVNKGKIPQKLVIRRKGKIWVRS